ncbi:hypothetical protein [Roseofilum sp. Belize Diploria]|uniref:hypothetical protein n=1 Tax=Roseofilum sp. Belize Diploria TaxID=2821501 RepID=UPI001AFF8E70|nr:hypothetical protein [Roseofilum sp. Belize Diploria]MBP0011491.1 hypothetical protein [Roseofilum sp. Belize Diploria]
MLDSLTFGISTFARRLGHGEAATRNHRGLFFNLGRLSGSVASIWIGSYAAPFRGFQAAPWWAKAALGYDLFGAGIGIAQSSVNIMQGKATWWDILAFLPFLFWAGARVKNLLILSETSESISRASQSSVAYRVQGGVPPKASWERVQVGADGVIDIIPEPGKTKQTKLYITFDDPKRAQVYLRDNRPGGQIVSFEVDSDFVNEVRANAVPQNQVRHNRGAPEISDPSRTTPSVRQELGLAAYESTGYGLPPKWIEKLVEAAKPGTFKIIK